MLSDVFKDLLGRTQSRRVREPNRLDKLQALGDAVGVADQSGITDLLNSGVSIIRAMRSKGQERREHVRDAVIRGVSAVPFVGDLAKLAKSGQYAKIFRGVQRSGTAAHAAPAAAGAARPGMMDFLKSMVGLRARQAVMGPAGNAGGVAASPPTQKQSWKELLTGLLSRGGRGAVGDSTDKPRGLTASEKMAMMGKSPEEIRAADEAKRREQEQADAEEEAQVRLQELTEKLKGATKGAGAFAVVLAALPKLTSKFGEALIESRRHLGEFNVTIAGAVARLDIQQFHLNRQLAAGTSDSTARLAEEVAQLREKLLPWKQAFTNIENYLGVLAVNSGELVLDGAALVGEMIPGFGIVKEILEEQKKMREKGEQGQGGRFLELLRMQEHDPAGGRPPLPDLK